MSTSHKVFAIICGMLIVALFGLAVKVAFLQNEVETLKMQAAFSQDAQSGGTDVPPEERTADLSN